MNTKVKQKLYFLIETLNVFGGKIYKILCRRLPLSPTWEIAATRDNLGQTTVH
jgi:hypothetical protein